MVEMAMGDQHRPHRPQVELDRQPLRRGPRARGFRPLKEPAIDQDRAGVIHP